MKTRFGINRDIYERFGINVPITVNVKKYPHLLLTGKSGSAKTHSLFYFINNLLDNENVHLWILDFKNGSDYRFLNPYQHYYSGINCLDGMRKYYELFNTNREHGTLETNELNLLAFDEYPAFHSYLSNLDKANKSKLSIEVSNMLSELLMLGRVGYGVWIITQRPDSSLFNSGSRDNFMNIISLGTLSKEAKQMVYPYEEIDETQYLSAGEGYILSDEIGFYKLKVPFVPLEQLQCSIWSKLKRHEQDLP